jgi:tetratricopeptide (TPR) repeat protein
MNRICRFLVPGLWVAAILLPGCQGNPFTYRDSWWKSRRPPADQWEPQAHTGESRSTATDRDRANVGRADVVQTRPDQNESPTTREPESVTQQRDEIASLLQRAEDALELGNQQKAVAFYQEVIRIQPTHMGALHRLAILNDLGGNFPQAELHFRRALQQAPDDPNLLNDLGYAYLRQQRLDESESLLRSSIELDPSNQITHRNLGILYALRGESELAEEHFLRGGLSAPEAHQEFTSFLSAISTPVGPRPAASINELVQSRNPPTSSAPFSPPSPDWESTYGLKSPASRRESAPGSSSARRTDDSAGAAGASLDNELREMRSTRNELGHTDPPREFSHSDRDFELERAALNTGPGSLFPIASVPRSETPSRQPHPPFAEFRDWNMIQPVGFGESVRGDRQEPYGENSSRVQPASREPRFIQSPLGRTIDPNHPSEDSTGFPVTQPRTSGGTGVVPSYYQFPGEGPNHSVDRALLETEQTASPWDTDRR